jgi:hypothetical protein
VKNREDRGMKRLCSIASIILVSISILSSGCNRSATEPQSYEYTSTNEIKQVEYYETERIRDAEKTVVMTLEQLGYSDLELAGGEEVESPAIEYTLPDDATQGPDTWYIVNFHFLIEFEEDTGGGFCDVRAKPGASVQFETQKVNDAPFIRVGGQSVTSTRVEVHYYNYMGLNDVKPGKNEMTFKYKEYDSAKVKSVTVYKDTDITVTATAPSEYDEGRKVTTEEKEKAKEIAFQDPRVQELAEGKEYAMRITRADGLIRLASDPPDDDIEIRLVFAETCMIEDVEASALDIFVDLKEGAVTYLFPLDASGMWELTASVRESAVAIAMNDANVKGLLEEKKYEITRVGGCEGGPVGRLGANMDIVFDKAYQFTGDFPYFPDERKYLDQPIEGIEVFVNLEDGVVVQIWPDIVLKIPDRGER